MDKNAADFMASFDDAEFPHGFTNDYEMLECISASPLGETYLVRSRITDDCCIAKCHRRRELLSAVNEGELLMRMRYKGVPRYIGNYENESMLCVLREYVPGESLDRCIDAPLDARAVCEIGIKLCDILYYIHRLDPPVIHRDIKPQNIVLGADGSISLIDFDISRVFDPAARKDTVIIGTRSFSAPEQYGFMQTDARTDIYSLGVVMCWLLTGSCDVRGAFIGDARLASIIRGCAAFDPKERYRNAAAVRRALKLHLRFI